MIVICTNCQSEVYLVEWEDGCCERCKAKYEWQDSYDEVNEIESSWVIFETKELQD